MSDSSILFTGIVCFSLVILCLVLTAYEFRKMKDVGSAPGRKPRAAYRT